MAIVSHGCTDVSVSKHPGYGELYKTKTQRLHCVHSVLLWTCDHSCAARTSATRTYCQRLLRSICTSSAPGLLVSILLATPPSPVCFSRTRQSPGAFLHSEFYVTLPNPSRTASSCR